MAAAEPRATGRGTSNLTGRIDSSGVAALLVRGVEYPETDSEQLEVATEAVVESWPAEAADAAAREALLGRPRGRLIVPVGFVDVLGAVGMDCEEAPAAMGSVDGKESG